MENITFIPSCDVHTLGKQTNKQTGMKGLFIVQSSVMHAVYRLCAGERQLTSSYSACHCHLPGHMPWTFVIVSPYPPPMYCSTLISA